MANARAGFCDTLATFRSQDLTRGSYAEFKTILKKLDSHTWDDATIDRVLSDFDVPSSGLVDYEELLTFLFEAPDEEFILPPVHLSRVVKCCQGRVDQDYIDMKRLGNGAFGTVFKGLKRTTKIHRALKYVPVAVSDTGESQEEELEREVRLLKRMDHPNVARLIEYYKAQVNDAGESCFVLVFTLCQGPTLTKFIEKQKVNQNSLADPLVAVILRQMLRAVQFCHTYDIMHKDIKPDNFVFSTERLLPLKLLDFGRSEIIKAGDSGKNGLGTFHWMAPEMKIAGNAWGKEADMWSIGSILFHMLSGEELTSRSVFSDKFFARTRSIELGLMIDLQGVQPTPLSKPSRKLLRSLSGGLANSRASLAPLQPLKPLKVSKPLTEAGPQGPSTQQPTPRAELLDLLLAPDPKQRPTALDAANTKYILSGVEQAIKDGTMCLDTASIYSDTSEETAVYIARMCSFAVKPALWRLTAFLLALRASEEEVASTAAWFNRIDTNAKGYVARAEFVEILKKLDPGLEDNVKTLDDFFSTFDINQDDSLSFNEFVAATLPHEILSDNNRMFAIFTELSGFRPSDPGIANQLLTHNITPDTLLAVLPDATIEETQRMVREVDQKGKSSIMWTEFKVLMKA